MRYPWDTHNNAGWRIPLLLYKHTHYTHRNVDAVCRKILGTGTGSRHSLNFCMNAYKSVYFHQNGSSSIIPVDHEIIEVGTVDCGSHDWHLPTSGFETKGVNVQCSRQCSRQSSAEVDINVKWGIWWKTSLNIKHHW